MCIHGVYLVYPVWSGVTFMPSALCCDCLWSTWSGVTNRSLKIVTGLHDSCCAQISILFAFTKAIDLKILLSLRCELTTSRQKHFSTRISLPATHQGSVKVSSKMKHLSCLELTPQKQLFMKILDNSNHAYMREVRWMKSSQKWNSKRAKSALQQKEKTCKKVLPFVTQYHPAVSNLKKILMSK